MGENAASKNYHNNHHLHNHHQVFDVSVDVLPQNGSKCFDDDGRLKRTGNLLNPSPVSALFSLFLVEDFVQVETFHIHVGWFVSSGTLWTASSHIITAVIGSGVLSLAWAIAQLGWIAGPAVMFLFSLVTYYTSSLLTDCYRTGDPDTGKRNYTYMDAVQSILGMIKINLFCPSIQKIHNTATLIQTMLECFIFFFYFTNVKILLSSMLIRRSKSQFVWPCSVHRPIWYCHWLHHCIIHKHDVSWSFYKYSINFFVFSSFL
jgi:hypothetical protein